MENKTLTAFIEAILGEPNDEAHRLVCSDWLEEQGREAEAEKYRNLPGTAAIWSSGWGRDNSGLWCVLRLEGIEQRLRWIAPGRFWMGSPEDEEGRHECEFRREVEIPRGFWMFDSPCTQGLWQVVKGDNPSAFLGQERPVEDMDWDDCQLFLSKLEDRVVGLHLRLPTEAEWEYACRAGTQTTRYHEDIDRIAWHIDNSKGETHPVKQKEPNVWGLYDMLGNVWEWCRDPWKYHPDDEPDFTARVCRGGYFYGVPEVARAASREGIELDDPGSGLGFRCVESGPVSE